MPAFLVVLIPIFVKFLVGTLIVRTITTIGLAIVTFAAADTIADEITGYMVDSIGGVSGVAAQAITAVGVVDAMNIIVAAYVSSIGIKQLKGVYNRLTFGGL